MTHGSAPLGLLLANFCHRGFLLPPLSIPTNVAFEVKVENGIIQSRFSHYAEHALENLSLVSKEYRGFVAIVSVKNLTFATITYS